MTVDQFVNKWIDKGIDFDGHYGFQCVDLYRQYVKEVLNVPQSPGVQGAADIWTSFLLDYFEKVPNSPTGVPKKGDIVIWNRRMGGGYGHVAVFLSGDVNSMEVFEQDGTINSKARLKVYKYTNVLGWLSPKVKSTQESMPEETIPVKKTDFETLVSKATELDELKKRGITEEYFTQLKRDLEGEREAFKAYKTDTETFIDKVASLLGSTADKEGIIKFATNLGKSLDDAGEWKAKYEKEMQARKADALEYSEKLIKLDERIVRLQADHQQEIDQMVHDHTEEIELIRQEIADALTKKEVAEAALKTATKFASFWKFVTKLGVK